MSPIEKLVDAVPLTPIEHPVDSKDGIPYATHKGVIAFGDVVIDVFQLNTGERVLDGEWIQKAVEMMREAME